MRCRSRSSTHQRARRRQLHIKINTSKF
jgi:hypothetical protein